MKLWKEIVYEVMNMSVSGIEEFEDLRLRMR